MNMAANFPLVFVCGITLLCGQSGCYGHTETYKLGGIREPVVTVKEDLGKFDVTVRFHAVDTFDSATNQKLTRQKGQGFALIALSRYMGVDRSQSVTVRGLTPSRMRLNARSMEMSFSIERAKIQKVNMPARMKAEPAQLVGHKQGTVGNANDEHDVPALDEREADYRDTIVLIDAGGLSSAADLTEVGSDLYEGIAGIEEKTLGLFEIVRRQAESDTFLQQEERGRIFAKIDRAHEDFLAVLRIELQILEASAK